MRLFSLAAFAYLVGCISASTIPKRKGKQNPKQRDQSDVDKAKEKLIKELGNVKKQTAKKLDEEKTHLDKTIEKTKKNTEKNRKSESYNGAEGQENAASIRKKSPSEIGEAIRNVDTGN